MSDVRSVRRVLAGLAAIAALSSAPPSATAKVTYNNAPVSGALGNDDNNSIVVKVKKRVLEIRKGNSNQLTTFDTGRLRGLADAYDEAGDAAVDLTNEDALVQYLALDYLFLVDGLIDTRTLKIFLGDQVELTSHLKNTPALFARSVVTVGFEHEFLKHHSAKSLRDADILGSDCYLGLTEVDHAELAESTTAINGLHFVIETDSDNQLELVTPPFLLRTSAPGIPLPHWKQVRAFEAVITRDVLTPVNQMVDKATRVKAPKRFPDLLKMLRQRGLDFPETPVDVDIEATQLTHRTPVIQKQVAKAEVAKVCLHSAPKGEVLIGHQINFATDAPTFTALKYEARKRTKLGEAEDEWVKVWLLALSTLKQEFEGEHGDGMKAFLLEYAAVIANQVARPSMIQYLAYVGDLAAGKQKALERAKDDKLENYEGLSSYAKDWSGFWLKSSLYNLGRALLTKQEWDRIADQSKGGGTLETRLEAAFHEINLVEFYDGDPDRAGEAKAHVVGLPRLLHQRFDQKYDLADYDDGFKVNDRRIQIFEHNDRDLGIRQDTYVGRKLVKMKAWEDRELFVVEDREEAPHNSLQALHDDIVELAKQNRGQEAITTRIAALWKLEDLFLPQASLKRNGETLTDEE